MTATLTNAPKHTVTADNVNRSGVAKWDDQDVSWDDPRFGWDFAPTSLSNMDKKERGYLIKEDAGYILLESGGKIIISGTVATNIPKA